MTSEALLAVFFERQLYTFLRHASAAERDSFMRGCGLTKLETSVLNQLYHDVQEGLQEEAFDRRYNDLKVQYEFQELFSFGSPSELSLQQCNEKFRQLVRDRTVLLRGPAEHIARMSSPSEEVDLIVHLNFDLPGAIAEERAASDRLDMLYHCCNGDVPIEPLCSALTTSTQMICFERGVASRRLKERCRELNVPTRDVDARYRELADMLGSPPSTGLLACYDLLSFDIKHLYVQGLTFFHTPYRNDYPHSEGAEARVHDKHKELAFVKELFRVEARFTADTVLETLILQS